MKTFWESCNGKGKQVVYQRIRDLREDADVSQEEIARRLHMHRTTYTRYE